jgi:hypothetical protein
MDFDILLVTYMAIISKSPNFDIEALQVSFTLARYIMIMIDILA